ncbi:MAG: anti-sigma F factor [Syntrophomonas sp.]|uniref:anti-sigma F factor n=1 Tax=Syntrophomonas sp. TaxID=2053627 RepID=UPI002628F39E|nr:anti-sigma F factor [Syntrophomonas sp.]MDD2511231.1 anti-sigma F factor [Syntrophomonas sp.]MDD3879803.1 anti-sigma F factor [Syntrophomonas sp.]MDD4626909.1 anti-sigma F factor [Syntrophomonas sp.]
MNVKNYVRFEFKSLAENVSFARSCVAAFASQLDCTLEDIEEIKVVVSEAVSNSIIHAYENRCNEKIMVMVSIMDDRSLEIVVEDHGKGIEDIEKALEPAFSSDSSRTGLGFTFMKSFMDEMEVFSQPGEGTTVRLKRRFKENEQKAYA